jgi:NADPH:quinone reductase-like Zn-dependent oxidoreductase
MGSPILVTGAAGTVGHAVCELLFAAETGEIARNSWSQAVMLSRAGGDVVVHGHCARVTYLRHCGVVALISKPHYHS